MIEIMLDKQSDAALVEYRPGRLTIDVTSASGIGGLQAELADGSWPEQVLVRLRLRGLERLELSYGNYTIVTSISSTFDPAPPTTLYTRDEDGSVTETTSPEDAFQPAITPHSLTQETPVIPLQDGYFEVALPAHFFETGERNFTLQWIDFYR